MMFPTLARSTPLLSSVISKQAFDIVYPFCLSWGLQGLTDGSASLKAEGRDERKKSSAPHLSTYCMIPKYAIARHMVWQMFDPRREK